MKTKDELIADLLTAIETSDTVCGDHILVRKDDAVRIVHLLSGMEISSPPPKKKDGRTLFYCAHCAKSFRAEGREDEECFAKWQYHTWYADCPWCGNEVTQNDRYWR